MKLRISCVVVGFLALVLSLVQLTFAQTTTQTPSALPRLVRLGGTVKNLNGTPLTGVVGITFAFYSEQTGGAALWLETQNVTADTNGRYTALLGSTKPEGLPPELFTSEQARWVGVQVSGQPEQPRVLLVSAPYALKAGDAETVGGLPASAFVLAAPTAGNGASTNNANALASGSVPPPVTSNVTTTGGTVNTIPLFTTATNIQNSAIAQTGSGTTAKVGIGTTTPAVTLDVKGAETVRGTLTLPATGAATATAGKNSQPQDLVASSFNSAISTAVNQTFQWQAEPAANNTTAPSGTLDLLYGLGATAPAETGLKISPKGLITFASGQTFPGTGTGTVKSVGLSAPSADFTVTGSPVTTTGTLNIAWKVAPTSANTANAIVKRDANGAFAAGGITSTSAGVGVTGQSFGTNAVSDGVDGVTSSGSASGVAGINNSGAAGSVGVYGTGGIGIYGTSSISNGVGTFGQYGTESGIGQIFNADAVGARGDGGSGGQIGVLGTTDLGFAGVFENNGGTTLFAYNHASSGFLFLTGNTGASSGNIDSTGTLNCTGSKNAVVPIDGGKRKVAMSAIESPQNWFEDFGSAELSAGSAVVALDPDFIQTVNTERDYMVIPVPNGECKGLYVTNQTPTSFEVRELGGGTSSIRFHYRVVALRKNYENVRFADHTNDPDPRKIMERMKGMRAKRQPTVRPTAQPVAAQPK